MSVLSCIAARRRRTSLSATNTYHARTARAAVRRMRHVSKARHKQRELADDALDVCSYVWWLQLAAPPVPLAAHAVGRRAALRALSVLPLLCAAWRRRLRELDQAGRREMLAFEHALHDCDTCRFVLEGVPTAVCLDEAPLASTEVIIHVPPDESLDVAFVAAWRVHSARLACAPAVAAPCQPAAGGGVALPAHVHFWLQRVRWLYALVRRLQHEPPSAAPVARCAAFVACAHAPCGRPFLRSTTAQPRQTTAAVILHERVGDSMPLEQFAYWNCVASRPYVRRAAALADTANFVFAHPCLRFCSSVCWNAHATQLREALPMCNIAFNSDDALEPCRTPCVRIERALRAAYRRNELAARRLRELDAARRRSVDSTRDAVLQAATAWQVSALNVDVCVLQVALHVATARQRSGRRDRCINGLPGAQPGWRQARHAGLWAYAASAARRLALTRPKTPAGARSLHALEHIPLGRGPLQPRYATDVLKHADTLFGAH